MSERNHFKEKIAVSAVAGVVGFVGGLVIGEKANLIDTNPNPSPDVIDVNSDTPTEKRQDAIADAIENGTPVTVLNGTIVEQLGEGKTRLVNNPIFEYKPQFEAQKVGDPLTDPESFYFYAAERDADGTPGVRELSFNQNTMNILGSGLNKGGTVVWVGTLEPQYHAGGRDEDSYEMNITTSSFETSGQKGGIPLVAEEYFGDPNDPNNQK